MPITPEEKLYLLGEMEELLQEYKYNYNAYALEKIIDEWATQKAPLIEAFKRHPHYLPGKFMIAYDYDYERTINHRTTINFKIWLLQNAIREAINFYPPEVEEIRSQEGTFLPWSLYDFFDEYLPVAERTISEDIANRINNILPQAHAHSGQKTSRVINKMLTYLGISQLPDYNKEFAKFADALSPMTIKRHTILSLHPNDYLTMSFGNSWASCHTIDKTNRRGMPNSYEGQYSSGTMSYMLDPSSMVLYTVASEYDGNKYYTQPKIVRQMFHYGEDKLIQGRLYPQDNDYDSEAYTLYRKFAQEVMATIMDIPNLWVVKKGCDIASRYVDSYGTHYRDYEYYNNCTLSTPKDIKNTYNVIIGADPICIECSCRHNIEKNINHCAEDDDFEVCAHCGCVIEYHDECWRGDEVYCCDCVTLCEVCECYEINENVHYVNSTHQNVCDNCLVQYFTYCEECEMYYPEEDVRFVEATDRCVCGNCFDEYYTCCPVCGTEYLTEDDCPNDCDVVEEVG